MPPLIISPPPRRSAPPSFFTICRHYAERIILPRHREILAYYCLRHECRRFSSFREFHACRHAPFPAERRRRFSKKAGASGVSIAMARQRCHADSERWLRAKREREFYYAAVERLLLQSASFATLPVATLLKRHAWLRLLLFSPALTRAAMRCLFSLQRYAAACYAQFCRFRDGCSFRFV